MNRKEYKEIKRLERINAKKKNTAKGFKIKKGRDKYPNINESNYINILTTEVQKALTNNYTVKAFCLPIFTVQRFKSREIELRYRKEKEKHFGENCNPKDIIIYILDADNKIVNKSKYSSNVNSIIPINIVKNNLLRLGYITHNAI